MPPRTLVRGAPARRGFTVLELLLAMALLVFVMSVLSAGFAEAAKGFRDLKAIGDQNERLRETAAALRRDLDAANADAATFVLDGLRTGKPDRETAAELRRRYTAVAADADAFDGELADLERTLTDPADRRIVRRARGYLDRISTVAAGAADLLERIERDSD